jgi:hypothetical protein
MASRKRKILKVKRSGVSSSVSSISSNVDVQSVAHINNGIDEFLHSLSTTSALCLSSKTATVATAVSSVGSSSVTASSSASSSSSIYSSTFGKVIPKTCECLHWTLEQLISGSTLPGTIFTNDVLTIITDFLQPPILYVLETMPKILPNRLHAWEIHTDDDDAMTPAKERYLFSISLPSSVYFNDRMEFIPRLTNLLYSSVISPAGTSYIVTTRWITSSCMMGERPVPHHIQVWDISNPASPLLCQTLKGDTDLFWSEKHQRLITANPFRVLKKKDDKSKTLEMTTNWEYGIPWDNNMNDYWHNTVFETSRTDDIMRFISVYNLMFSTARIQSKTVALQKHTATSNIEQHSADIIQMERVHAEKNVNRMQLIQREMTKKNKKQSADELSKDMKMLGASEYRGTSQEMLDYTFPSVERNITIPPRTCVYQLAPDGDTFICWSPDPVESCYGDWADDKDILQTAQATDAPDLTIKDFIPDDKFEKNQITGRLAAVSIQTGTQLWTVPTKDQWITSIIVNHRFVVARSRGLCNCNSTLDCFSLQTGVRTTADGTVVSEKMNDLLYDALDNVSQLCCACEMVESYEEEKKTAVIAAPIYDPKQGPFYLDQICFANETSSRVFGLFRQAIKRSSNDVYDGREQQRSKSIWSIGIISQNWRCIPFKKIKWSGHFGQLIPIPQLQNVLYVRIDQHFDLVSIGNPYTLDRTEPYLQELLVQSHNKDDDKKKVEQPLATFAFVG